VQEAGGASHGEAAEIMPRKMMKLAERIDAMWKQCKKTLQTRWDFV
jgi:hypothetical protein